MYYFYYFFRPWAMIIKITGIFPVAHTSKLDPRHLKYKKSHIVYSLFCFCFCCFIIVYSGGEYLFEIKDIPMRSCLQLVVLASAMRSLLSYLCFALNSKKLPALIVLLDTYDKKKFESHIFKKSSYKYDLIKWTISPILGSFFFFLVYAYFSAKTFDKLIDSNVILISPIFFGGLAFWYVYPLTLYIYLSARIINNFEELNEILIKNNIISGYINPKTKVNVDFNAVHTFRFLHNMLSECVYHLEYACGETLALDQICMIFIMVVNLAVIKFIDMDISNLLIMTLISVGLALKVIANSQGIKEQVSTINLYH